MLKLLVIDLFRATTVISIAFEYGISKIIPVTSLEDALILKIKKIIYLQLKEIQIKGFDYGNSLSYINKNIKDKTLVLTH